MTHTILVVDDSPAVRALLTDVLTAAGYRVKAAPDGAAALRLVAQARPDFIITDVQMPRLDGLGLVSTLRTIGLDQIPTLVMSGEPCPEGVSAGSFLHKPLDLNMLLRIVQDGLAAAPEAGVAGRQE